MCTVISVPKVCGISPRAYGVFSQAVFFNTPACVRCVSSSTEKKKTCRYRSHTVSLTTRGGSHALRHVGDRASPRHGCGFHRIRERAAKAAEQTVSVETLRPLPSFFFRQKIAFAHLTAVRERSRAKSEEGGENFRVVVQFYQREALSLGDEERRFYATVSPPPHRHAAPRGVSRIDPPPLLGSCLILPPPPPSLPHSPFAARTTTKIKIKQVLPPHGCPAGRVRCDALLPHAAG